MVYTLTEVPITDPTTVEYRFLYIATLRNRGIFIGRDFYDGAQFYAYSIAEDGTISKSATAAASRSPSDVLVVDDETIAFWHEGSGWACMKVDEDGEPSWAAAPVTPAAHLTNVNNVINWTVHNNTLHIYGRAPHPTLTMQYYTAPLNPDGTIGAFSSVGTHTLTIFSGSSSPQDTLDYSLGRGGSVYPVEDPDRSLFAIGTGNGVMRWIDMATDPTTVASSSTPPAGSASTPNPYSQRMSIRRGPGVDWMLVHRDNLDERHEIQEWTFDGSTYQVAEEWIVPQEDLDTEFPGREPYIDEYMLKTTDGKVVNQKTIYDPSFYEIGGLIYVDLFGTDGPQMIALKPETQPHLYVGMYPIEVPGGKVLFHAFEYDDDQDVRTNERLLLLEPEPSEPVPPSPTSAHHGRKVFKFTVSPGSGVG